MKRMYYAEYCRWGVNVSYDSMGGRGNAFTFYVFGSKAKRDEWVDDNEWNGYPNRTAATTTRRTVEYCCGKDFSKVETKDDGVYICCRKGDENYISLDLLGE